LFSGKLRGSLAKPPRLKGYLLIWATVSKSNGSDPIYCVNRYLGIPAVRSGSDDPDPLLT
jgi:hypothetical protein